MRRGLLLTSLVLLLIGRLHGQSCGRSDTLLMPANTNGLAFTLSIADYINDDLADPEQGLCGIELHFVHQFVENLELSLTSPAGQTVQLIGPNGDDQFDFTFFTQWRINFVPAAGMPLPDPGFAPQWDNEQPSSFVSGATYTGSYWPFNGSLEDFNTGPVNGDWTITVNNNPSNYPGALTYLRLFFCDSRGVDCCFAVAGSIDMPDFSACQGDTSLAFLPELIFPGPAPDTAEYGYQFLIGADSVYIGLDSLVDLSDAPAGEYQVCGFSYRRNELDSLPAPDGLLTIDSLQNNINGFEAWLCGDVTPTCLTVTIAAPPDTTVIDRLICAGDSTDVAGSFFSAAGTHFVTLPASTGCDSIVQLNLDLFPIPIVELDRTICLGDSATIGNQTYFTTGIYEDTLTTQQLGCDSIVRLNLTVLDPIFTDLSPFICAGDGLAVGDSSLTTSGFYEINLASAAGCDSIVRVDLTVLDPSADIVPPEEIDCANNGTVLDGTASTPSAVLAYTWLDPVGQELGSSPTLPVELAGDYQLIVEQNGGGTVCRDTAIANVTDLRSPVSAQAGVSGTLDCQTTVVNLSSIGSSAGLHITYQWRTTDATGAFAADSIGPAVAVTAGGVYQLIVTDTLTSCTNTTTVSVAQDITPPTVEAGTGFTLTCDIAAGSLQGAATAGGASFGLNWIGPCLPPNANTAAVAVDCPGWYYLTATNLDNQCTATDSVQVLENRTPPEALTAAPDTLTCDNTSVDLSGAGSTPMGNISFAWAGAGILSGGSQSTATVDQGGAYQLVVTRLDNGCRDTAAVTVAVDTVPPALDLPTDTLLNCYANAAPVRNLAPVPSDAHYSFTWTRSGQPVPNGNTDSLLISQAGTYTLEATDLDNGCTATAEISVVEDFAQPAANAGPNADVDCLNTTVQLFADSTGYSEPVQPSWSGPCIQGPTEGWNVTVNCPGIYTLTVTRLSNGCSRDDDTEVILLDTTTDAVLAADTAFIDCQVGTAMLDATGTLGEFTNWYLDGTSIGLPFPVAEVSQPGLYTLIARNAGLTCSDTAQTLVLLDCGLSAVIAPPQNLTCTRQSVTLDGSASSGDGALAYTWLAPGAGCLTGNADAPTATAICPGDYGLVLTQTSTGLRDTAWVSVSIDTVPPLAEAGPDLEVNCETPIVTLTGGPQPFPPGTGTAWTTGLGDTISQNVNLSTSEAGTYFFTVENLANGCRTTDFAVVSIDNQVPEITFGSEVFPCMESTFVLEAFVSPPDDDYEFTWTGPGILNNEDSLEVTIATPGWYTLLVVHPTTGCQREDSVRVVEQTCVPCLELGPVDTLDCTTTAVTLTADFCLPCEGCTLNWSDVNGPIGGADQLNLTVTEPGSYTLSATDSLGFTNAVTATVVRDVASPLVDIGPDRLITCDSTQVTLGTADTETGANFSLSWQDLSGNPLPGNSPFFTATSDGAYVLTVTNLGNGCTGLDTAAVSLDTLPPAADAGPVQSLTCETNLVVLDGSGSTLNGVTYQWEGPAPGCVQGAQGVNPLVSCAGVYYLTVTDQSSGCTAVDSVSVLNTAELPEVLPLSDTVLTCANPTVTLTGELSDTGDFTYRWCRLNDLGEEITTTCEFSLTYPVDEPGEYRFTLLDEATGCENGYTVTVGLDTLPPTVDAGPGDVLPCTLDSLQLNGQASAGALLAWMGRDGQLLSDTASAAPWVYAPGWYELTATFPQSGCSATDSVFVAQDANAPTLLMGSDTMLTCAAPTVLLSAEATTGSGSVSWLWSGPAGGILEGANTASPRVALPGTYQATAADPQNGCQVSDSLLVTADFRQPTAGVAGLDTLELNCLVDTLQLDANTSVTATGAGLTYQWTAFGAGQLFPDLTASQVESDRPGNYRLIVTDTGNGCRDTLAFTLSSNTTPPALEIQPPDTLTCVRDTVVLSAVGSSVGPEFTYTWVGPQQTSGSELTFVASTPGYHRLTIRNATNGCSRTDSVLVRENRQRPAVAIQAPAVLTCTQSSVPLIGSASPMGPNYAYAWTTNDGQLLGPADGAQDSAGAPGDYQLVVTNPRNGCDGAAMVTVRQDGAPITEAEVAVEPPPCPGDLFGSLSVDAVTGGTPPYRYALNGGTPGPNVFFEDLPTGNYELLITDQNGCSWRDTFNLPPPEPFRVNLGSDTTIVLGDSIRLQLLGNQPIATASWQPKDFGIPDNELMPLLEPLEDRYVWVLATNAEGCVAGDTLRISVEKNRPLFIPTAFSPNGDGRNDEFTVYAGQEVVRVDRLRIFDRWGNMVFSRENFAPNDPRLGWDGYFEDRRVNSAVFVYFVEVTYIDGWTETVTGEVMVVW